MKHVALAALLVVLVPLQATALENEELLGLVAMPLAVAAVSDVTGVPVGDLSHFVATLNRAQVPPTQIVQVVRYAPVALVVEDPQPTFVEYVDQQVDQGVIGPQLVTVIENRYRTYDLEPQFITLQEPATTYVVREDYIPPAVVTRVTEVRPAYGVGDTHDLLALVAMPLAVAAVSDMTGVPFGDLSSFVSSLNAARVPPLQFVEVLRYSPVVLVADDERPRFVQFVRTEVVRGVTGPALIEVIDQRLRSYDVTPEFDAVRPQEVLFVDDRDFFPAAVTTRVAEVRAHPHGGPPGQLKKELGLQTGAEVVHGTRPASGRRDRVAVHRDDDDGRQVVREQRRQPRTAKQHERSARRVTSPRRVERVETKKVDRPRRERREAGHPRVEPRGNERSKPSRIESIQGGGKGNGQGKGKGKGKG